MGVRSYPEASIRGMLTSLSAQRLSTAAFCSTPLRIRKLPGATMLVDEHPKASGS